MNENNPSIIFKIFLWCTIIILGYLPIGFLLKKNLRRKKISTDYASQIKNGTLKIQETIKDFSFPIFTIQTDKNLLEIHRIVLLNISSFQTFLGIEDVSECYHSNFILLGNFVSTTNYYGARRRLDILTLDYDSAEFERLYSGNFLFQINKDNSLTLFMERMPEDKNHDFYVKDFITCLKEILK